MSPDVGRMLIARSIVWPVATACYASAAAAWFHIAFGGWTGVTSLGLYFSVFVGAPSLVGYAGYLWRKDLLLGVARWEAIVCAAFPVVLLLLAGFALLARRQ